MSTAEGVRAARPGLLVLIVVAVAVAAVVAGWLTGRLPGGDIVPLTLRDGAPPLLDCGGGRTSGGLVAGGAPVPQDDLPSAAADEREASAQTDVLTRLTGYRAGKDLVVVWSDAALRPRLVLHYTAVGQGYALTSRSGCA